MKNNAIKVNPLDNVAIVILPIKNGEPVVVHGDRLCQAVQDVEPSHKIALTDIRQGENVIRYGEPIVQALNDIKQGQWVHVHNTQPVPGDPDK